MPIYEEKLICPLAVRFTQQHIRPIFQEGHDIEATIKEIKTRPGTGEYDVILEAPFPNIEVVRWYQQDDEHVERDSEHWFTLDNRRLYSLQRVAVALWPRRVAAVVELLYAPTEGIWRKDDSSTVGRSVGIGHSLKCLTGRWDWREAIPSSWGSAACEAARNLILADDARASVDELIDAPAPPGMLDLYLQSGGLALEAAVPKPRADAVSEESTANPASPRSWGSLEEVPSQATVAAKVGLELAKELLAGMWWGAKWETYAVHFSKGESWTCLRTDYDGGFKKFSLWYDGQHDLVWWGTNFSHYLDLSEVRKQGTCLKWRDGTDVGNGRPRFTWQRVEASAGGQEEDVAARVPQYVCPGRLARKPSQRLVWVPASGQS